MIPLNKKSRVPIYQMCKPIPRTMPVKPVPQSGHRHDSVLALSPEQVRNSDLVRLYPPNRVDSSLLIVLPVTEPFRPSLATISAFPPSVDQRDQNQRPSLGDDLPPTPRKTTPASSVSGARDSNTNTDSSVEMSQQMEPQKSIATGEERRLMYPRQVILRMTKPWRTRTKTTMTRVLISLDTGNRAGCSLWKLVS